MFNFIKPENSYILEEIDLDNLNMVVIVDGCGVELTWSGDVRFSKEITHYDQELFIGNFDDISLTINSVDDEQPPVDFNLNKNFIYQFIAQYELKKRMEF